MNLLKMIQQDGTYSFTGNPVALSEGYMVGIKGLVLVDPTLLSNLTTQLYRWYNEVAIRLQLPTYFGVWRDKGLIYVDVSVQAPTKQLALELGAEFHQLAIWDCQARQEVRL